MKFSILASLLASAAAFAPQQMATPSRTALKSTNVDELPGNVNLFRKSFKEPLDPLSLSKSYSPLLPFFREAELRNGRTAMLAVVGFIVQGFVRLPGEAYSFENCPKVIDAPFVLGTSPESPMFQVYLWIALWEVVVTLPAVAATMKGEREPGDYGLKDVGLGKAFAGNDEKYKFHVDSELLNGRLAMLAFMGMHSQVALYGKDFPFF